ncbi:MAG: YdeI/OmpD-associated family protein [Solirubrobacterales bacterium]|nr:YdeI/OmpD-associated family protein [Solirubrobacterales bacterium]
MKFAKKGSGAVTVTHAEALQAALCYGWIDGQGAKFDERHWLVRFTPRGPRSKWSQINRQSASELIAGGRMRPAGLAAVAAAKHDGRWADAYEPQSRASVPADFQRALDEHPAAKEFFGTLTGVRRYAFLYRLHHTGPGKRAERIAGYIELLSERKTLN